MNYRRAALVFAFSCLLLLLLIPLASHWPDGLERTASDFGFSGKGEGGSVLKSPLPDYRFPGIMNEALSRILAGVLGTAGAFAAGYMIARLLKRRSRKP